MPPRRRSYDAVVTACERALDASGVDHVFVGGIAVIAFGRRRTTEDVDVLAAYRESDAAALLAEFRRRGFRVAEDDLRAALVAGEPCTIDDTRSDYRIDLSSDATPSARHALRTAVLVRFGALRLPLARPEHTIVMKLKFGSEQDIEDALSVYLRQKPRLDRRLMRTFAARQAVSDALESLLERAQDLERAQP